MSFPDPAEAHLPREEIPEEPEEATHDEPQDAEELAASHDVEHAGHYEETEPSEPVPATVPRFGRRSKRSSAEEPSAGDLQEDEEGGGPVKSFLEHLEDLRWTLIKSVVALFIGMVVCLIAANFLVEALLVPLDKAQKRMRHGEQVLLIKSGTNILWRVNLQTNQIGPLKLRTNAVQSLELVTVAEGTNHFLGLAPGSEQREDQAPKVIEVKNYSPAGPFVVAIKLALWGGLGLASPFVLYFIGQFVVPALRRNEKRILRESLGYGTLLFLAGAAFCYFVVIQIALNASVQFSRWMNFGADEWRAEEYISFVIKLMLGMGLAFELPVVLLTLVKLQLLDYEKLTRFRPYWVVVNMVLSSILTPPDPVSMIMMAIPLQLLYEFSVFVARIWKRREGAREAAAEAES